MQVPRRKFIQYVGIVLSSLLVTHCRGNDDGQGDTRPTATPSTTCYTVVPLTPTPDFDEQWAALGTCWLELDNPTLKYFEDNDRKQCTCQATVGPLDGLHLTVDFTGTYVKLLP